MKCCKIMTTVIFLRTNISSDSEITVNISTCDEQSVSSDEE
jgi:hypothetical protein